MRGGYISQASQKAGLASEAQILETCMLPTATALTLTPKLSSPLFRLPDISASQRPTDTRGSS